MTQKPQIEVRATLSLALVGTSITVKSFEEAIEQLKRQASITGKSQNLLVDDAQSSMFQISTETVETVFTEPDATLSASSWSLLVDGATKVTLPKAAPLIARAKALAAHQNVDHILVTSASGTKRVELTENALEVPLLESPKRELEEPLPATPSEQPLPVEPKHIVRPTTAVEIEPISDSSAPTEAVSNEPSHTFSLLDHVEEPPSSSHGQDRIIEEDEDTVKTDVRSRSIPRRALLIGLSAAAVLGIGSFAAYKLFGNGNPTQSVAPPDPPLPPVLEPPFPGVEPEALRQFPMAYSEVAISADGKYVAVQISDSEVSVQKSNGTGELPGSETIDGEIFSFEGKLAPPILPLNAQYGAGFILRILDSSGNLGASSKLIVWTPKNSAVTHKLPIGSQLTSRGGHSWISSTIQTTAPRTVQAITAEKLETYTAPSYGPALFGLLPKSAALWASIESDNTASILTCNAKGKISATGILKRPAKSAVVAKWIAATADHALMLWKNTDGHVLVLHETKTGKITGKADFKFPDGTTADRLPSRNTTDGNIVILGSTWADLKTGKFGSPEGIDLNKVEAHPRPGGVELRTDAESTFRPDSGATFSVPNQGTVIAVTKEVVIVEESRLVSVYRKTTTEGK